MPRFVAYPARVVKHIIISVSALVFCPTQQSDGKFLPDGTPHSSRQAKLLYSRILICRQIEPKSSRCMSPRSAGKGLESPSPSTIQTTSRHDKTNRSIPELKFCLPRWKVFLFYSFFFRFRFVFNLGEDASPFRVNLFRVSCFQSLTPFCNSPPRRLWISTDEARGMPKNLLLFTQACTMPSCLGAISRHRNPVCHSHSPQSPWVVVRSHFASSLSTHSLPSLLIQ